MSIPETDPELIEWPVGAPCASDASWAAV